jgi:hypothetical protein
MDAPRTFIFVYPQTKTYITCRHAKLQTNFEISNFSSNVLIQRLNFKFMQIKTVGGSDTGKNLIKIKRNLFHENTRKS